MSRLPRRLILQSSKMFLSPDGKAPSSPGMTIPYRGAPPTDRMAPPPRRTTSSLYKRTLASAKPLLLVLLMITESLGDRTFKDNQNSRTFHCVPEDMKTDNRNPTVFGTDYYTRTSSICLSALHAGFLTTAGGEVNYTYSGRKKVVGTVRNRVLSKSKEGKKTVYSFKGRRPVDDTDPNTGAIILHNSYNDPEKKILLKCFGGHRLTRWNHVAIPKSYGDRPLKLEEAVTTNLHAFVCEGEKPWQDSRAAFSLSLCKTNGETYCSIYASAVATYTGSVESSLAVDLNPVLQDDNTRDLYVRRLPDDPSTTPGFPLNKTFVSLEVGNDGIYIAGREPNFGVNGVYFDIMVRDCPDQRWGPDCAHWCPDCQNGGQCHPSTGKCVCAPGFKGPTCSSGCDKDMFGPECQFKCSDFPTANSNQQGCLSLTACVPFPRGCSCLPGYKGPQCNRECEKSEYGCGCSYQCSYCVRESCNTWNGQCTEGCKDDVPCDNNGFPLDLPRLKQQPIVQNITDKSVKVKFKAVENSSNNILNYIVQYFEVKSQVWKNGTTVEQRDVDASSNWVTTRISGLHPDSKYIIQVLVNTHLGFNDERSNKRIPRSEPFITQCTELKNSPGIYVNASQRYAVFSTENETLYGNSCNTSIKILSFSDSSVHIESSSFHSIIKVSSLTQDTCYTVQGLIKNKDSETTFKPVEFCTLPNRPSKVRNLSVEPSAATAQIVFEKPEEKVTHYIVSIQKGDGNTCHLLPEYNPKRRQIDVAQLPVHVSDLSPNQNYKTCVQAVNRGGLGQEACTTFKTRPKAPENNLHITSCDQQSCQVMVKGNCSQHHGDKFQVLAFLQGFRACDSYHWNQTVTVYNSGKPEMYTAYYPGLDCGITYLISFTIQNEAGKGQSVRGNFTTNSCAPPLPKIGTVTTSSITSITLFWNDTCPSKGPITYYDIRYREDSGFWWTYKYSKTGECHKDYGDRCYTIEGLPSGKIYEIQIRADNGQYSWWSESSYGETTETAPDPPNGVTVHRNETSLGFNITLPKKANGKLHNCTVLLSSNHSCTAELEKDIAFTFCMINGLSQGTIYKGQSRCYNSKKGKSLEVHAATLPVPPRLITKLQFFSELSTDNTFTISLPGLEQEGEGMSEVAVLLNNASSQTNPNFGYTRFFLEEMERKASTYSSEEDIDFRRRCNTESLDKCRVKEKGPVRVAALIEKGKNQLAGPGKRFTVGDGKEYGKFCNAPLTKGSSYHVAAVACTALEGERRCTENKLPIVVHVQQYTPLSWAAVVLPLLLFLAVLLVLILYRKGYLQKYLPAKEGTQKQNQEEHIPITKQMIGNSSREVLPHGPDLPPPPTPPSVLVIKQPTQHSTNRNTHGINALSFKESPYDYPGHLPGSKAPPYFDDDSTYINIGQDIPREEVESFLNEVTVKGMFDQFVNIPVICKEKSENDGLNARNGKKNRYKNNLPYDQTRVRLSIIDDDPYSDYINANHVQGCGSELKYIATQGPKDDNVCTIGDFWRMALEQDVKAIIMVANFVEGDRIKVGEYFNPSRVMEWDGHYVSVIKQKRMPHYTVSTIKVVAVDGSAFTVKHYHYLSWPDHNVPMETRSLACMIREVIWTHRQGSVVVHCSAGIGRTGTVLFVLLLHDMLKTQNVIDPIRVLAQMRHCRGRLLESEIQFRFALQLFDEVLFGKTTLRSKGGISANLNKILQHQSQAEFQRLCSLASGLSYTVDQEQDLISLNRNPKILPSITSQVFLELIPRSVNSQYINAVQLLSSEPPSALIATEYPMTNTCAAFWRLLYGENSPLLVIVNTFDSHDKNYPYLFPVLGDSLKVGETTVTLRETSQPLPSLLQHTIDLHYHRNVHTMLVYIFQSWPHEDELPSSLSDLVDLGEKLREVLQKSSGNPVVLCCADGVRGCGILAGVLKILDSLINYDEIDVYRTAVSLRRDREQFIPTQIQYDFLYQTASYYIQQNNLYENIKDAEDPNPIYENIMNAEDPTPIYENI